MDIVMLMNKGGPVMWILLGYSVVAIAIIAERLFLLSLLSRSNQEAASTKYISPETVMTMVVKNAATEGVKDLTRVASRVGSEQLVRLESGLRTLAWLGNTAPLLGLFGTITGMIKAFQVIEESGGKVDAQMLAGGIWEAMVTTGAGLAVAIPILLALHLLEGLVDKHAKAMQHTASMLIEQLPHSAETFVQDSVVHQQSVSHAV